MEIVEEETKPDAKRMVKIKAKFVLASNIFMDQFPASICFLISSSRKLIHDLKKLLSKMLIVRLEILTIFRDIVVGLTLKTKF